jgi:hypothetical protein
MALTLTTRLEAVNTIIGVIGEHPVNTLDATGGKPVQVVVAENLLDDTSREVQSEGWAFNTEKDYTLIRDSDNKIILPSNTLRVDTEINKYTDIDIVQRGTKLYDRKNHRETFTKNLDVEITFLLDFTEIPESFRRWITIRAARKMAARYIGSGEMETFTLRDEYEARRLAKSSDSASADRSVFDNLQVFQTLVR